MPQDIPVSLQNRLRIKYLLDRILAWVLLIILGPFILLVVFLIKVEGFLKPNHSGPAFCREPRVSEGRVIQMLKFRTVTTAHLYWIRKEPESRSVSYPTKNRTRVGKIIMNSYLDELPQLWNIARGEMSFVGPRPDSLQMHEKTVQDGFIYRNYLRGGLLGITQACKSNEKYKRLFQELARQYTDRKAFPHMLDEFYLKWIIKNPPSKILLLDIFVIRKSLRTFFVGEQDEWLLKENR
jgi:lipopolysaccharide/colanic/teichoic acid biosynthesis glycosyltransferase